MTYYTEMDIETAKRILKTKIGVPIVEEFNGFIVLAQSERDYRGKCNRILKGDTFGFYTVKTALNAC